MKKPANFDGGCCPEYIRIVMFSLMFTLFFLSFRVFLCHFKVFFTIYFTSLGGPGLQGGPGDMAKAAPRLSGSTSATVKILARCGPGAHHGVSMRGTEIL